MSIQDKIISVEEFNAMKEVYNEKIKKKVGEAYSDFVIISIKELKEYIAMIEAQAADNETTTENIKFHFVSENTEKGQLTLVLEGVFANENLKAPLLDKKFPCPPLCEPPK